MTDFEDLPELQLEDIVDSGAKAQVKAPAARPGASAAQPLIDLEIDLDLPPTPSAPSAAAPAPLSKAAPISLSDELEIDLGGAEPPSLASNAGDGAEIALSESDGFSIADDDEPAAVVPPPRVLTGVGAEFQITSHSAPESVDVDVDVDETAAAIAAVVAAPVPMTVPAPGVPILPFAADEPPPVVPGAAAVPPGSQALDLDAMLADLEMDTKPPPAAELAPPESLAAEPGHIGDLAESLEDVPPALSALDELEDVGPSLDELAAPVAAPLVVAPLDDPEAPPLPISAEEPPPVSRVPVSALMPDPSTLETLRRLAGPAAEPAATRAALRSALTGDAYDPRQLPDARAMMLGIARTVVAHGVDVDELLDAIMTALAE